jgi:hypothetical protein
MLTLLGRDVSDNYNKLINKQKMDLKMGLISKYKVFNRAVFSFKNI